MLASAIKEFKEQRLLITKRCVVGEWVAALSEEDQESFSNIAKDPMMATRDMHQICRSVGATFSVESVRRHRNQECACL
jgi:hypothetical protein